MTISSQSLAGRVAIVTGGSRGIGAALACALARERVTVIMEARSEQVWNDRLPGTIHETAARVDTAFIHLSPISFELPCGSQRERSSDDR
jgi:NAD(P)-dependent dehydrogenase (short-subunit alcohol dehydrogenase family)